MIKIKDKLLLRHELKTYSDFFYMFSEILNGVILRKHFILFFVGNNKEKLKEWERIGLIEIRRISNVNVILLRHCKALNNKRRPDFTRALILRSILRMEFYLYTGPKTPAEIRQYSDRGNNKVNRENVSKELLSGYKGVLQGCGVDLPDLDGKATVDALNRLTCHNVFIAELRLRSDDKSKMLIPCGVLLATCEDKVSQLVKELLFAYRELAGLFYECSAPVKPVLLLCTFTQKNLMPTIFNKLRQAPEFRDLGDKELSDIFLILSFESPFTYLDPTKLV